MTLIKSSLASCVLAFALARCVSAQVSVTTWQADNNHTGNNPNETSLTPGTVSSPGNFGLLFTQTLNGQTYGQPMVAAGVNVSGTTYNVVYVATQRCEFYAFNGDAATGGSTGTLWHDTLLPTGTVPVPQSVVGSGDILDTLGITTTPVIDPSSSTIYIVSKVQRTSDTTYHQYLYAVDLATGAYKFGSPVEINPTFPGNSSDAVNHVIPFSALHEHLRCAMALNNGLLYLAYASHSDTTPYHGEILAYTASNLQLSKSFIAARRSIRTVGFWNSGESRPSTPPATSSWPPATAHWATRATRRSRRSRLLPIPTGSTGRTAILKLPPDTFTVSYSQPLNWFYALRYWPTEQRRLGPRVRRHHLAARPDRTAHAHHGRGRQGRCPVRRRP